ncbi:MAG: hypothetical protein M1836_007450 [Candelina mexicana]|nr:MAG: hypothetical protein M1836_007450 [Candelina mexicana]
MVQLPTSTVLSPRQLQDLRKGPQATIFLGSNVESRVVVYSGVFKKILSHFSAYCKQKLIAENQTSIWIERGVGSKETVKFAVDWMVCGGRDARNKLPAMDIDAIVDLFQIVDFLKIKFLKEQTLQYLEKALASKKLGQLLPLLAATKGLDADAITKALVDELCVQICETTPTIEQITLIYSNTSTGSNLRKATLSRVAHLILDHKISAVPYIEYGQGNKEFEGDLDLAMSNEETQGKGQGAPVTAPTGPRDAKAPTRTQAPPVCGACKKVGHAKEACYRLYPELIPVKQGAKKGCTHCFQYGHLANECKKPFCTYCEKVGHLVSDCFALYPEKAPPRAAWIFCDHCGKPDHTEEGCWRLHPELAPPRIEVAVLPDKKGKKGGKGKITYSTKKSDTPSTSASLLDYMKPARK